MVTIHGPAWLALVPLVSAAAFPVTPTWPPVSRSERAGAATLGVPFDPQPGTARCQDPASSWLGTQWVTTYRWFSNLSSAPPELRASALSPMTSAASTVATGGNDCGLPALNTPSQLHAGHSPRTAAIASSGTCGRPDRTNVLSFGSLPPGVLAVSCLWWVDSSGDRRTVEADILVNDAEGLFFTSRVPPATCRGQWDLQGVLTHEFGHVFGLGHVSFAHHPTLTMSDQLLACSSVYRVLGLGEYERLRRQYAVTSTR